MMYLAAGSAAQGKRYHIKRIALQGTLVSRPRKSPVEQVYSGDGVGVGVVMASEYVRIA